jgi:CHAT domain-containing protein
MRRRLGSCALCLALIAIAAPARATGDAARENDAAIALADSGDLEGALAAWDRAAAAAAASGDTLLRARVLANAGRALVLGGEAARAKPRLAEALELSLASAGPESNETLISVGHSQTRVAEAEHAASGRRAALLQAHHALSAALERSLAAGDLRTTSLAAGRLAEVYAASGRDDDAIALARRALFAAQQSQALELVALWNLDLGRSLARRGELEAATEALRQSARGAETLRAQHADAALAELQPANLELVDLLLQRAAAVENADERTALLREARDASERGKRAELRDYFRDECVDAARAKVKSVDESAGSAAVLYPIVLPDRTELLLSLPSPDPGVPPRIERVGVKIPAADVIREVRALRKLLEKRTTRQYLTPARRLYDLLIRPIEPLLTASGAKVLVWVPDGALRTIPLAALQDGEHFLIERFAIATTPGLSLTDPQPMDRTRMHVLLSGVSKGVQGAAPLGYVREELGSLHALLGGEELLDEKFEAKRFEHALAEEPFGIVHVASHGEFHGDAAQSYLLAWDGKVTMEALGRAIGAHPFREVPLEMLTLSACETAEGDDRAALGFAGVALRTGARSVLGTLWQVNDQAAADLVVSFYRQLGNPDVSRAEALRTAQLAQLHDEAHAHPAFWAAFVLIGSWL